MNAACVPIKGMCIVGRFAVRQDACASDVDDAYVVVREEGALELEDICVLEQSHIHSLSSKNSIVNMCRTHGLSLLVILYLLILAYISTG